VVETLVQRQIPASFKDRILTYYEYTKPKIWYLLVFTSLTATFVADSLLGTGLSLVKWITAAVAITAGCAGCNSLTNYIDETSTLL